MNIISRLELVTKAHPAKAALIYFSELDKRWETITFQQLGWICDYILASRACRPEWR
jgi:hypothetical protein